MKVALGLAFPGELQDESIICSLCKNFQINLNIIEASFSMTSGWAFLELEGEKPEIDRALEYLRGKKVKIQEIKQK